MVGISKMIAPIVNMKWPAATLPSLSKANNISDIVINEITPMFITDFELYLRSICKCGYNTTAKFMQFFKRIILIASNNNILTDDPFANYKKLIYIYLILKTNRLIKMILNQC